MTMWPNVIAANGRQAIALHIKALRGARLTSNTPLTRLTSAPSSPAKQAAHTPIAEAGDAQMYLSAVVVDMAVFVRVSIVHMLATKNK